ncbi:hypothetical protein [Trichothermofontia sp.]
MENAIALRMSVQDPEATAEELQMIVGILAAELDRQAAEVVAVAEPGGLMPESPEWVEKGERGSSLLDITIDIGVLKEVAGWLYDRLLGTGTEVKFTYGELAFEFKGRNDRDRAAAMQDFTKFVSQLEAAKRAKDE